MLIFLSRNNEVAAKVLVDAGADVNSRSIKEDTPLMVAAAVGHYPVLKYLLQHPQIDLCAQVQHQHYSWN